MASRWPVTVMEPIKQDRQLMLTADLDVDYGRAGGVVNIG